MVESPPRDNGKVLSITVVAGADIGASAGAGGGSQRAATCALGCGALAATGTSAGIGASDVDWTRWKVAVFTDSGWFGTVGSPCDNGFFSITVAVGAVIVASSGGAGGSQRAAT